MSLGKELLDEYNPEQLQQEFLRTFSELTPPYYACARTGLVIAKREVAPALECLDADRKALIPTPKPFIQRNYYAVVPQEEDIAFALIGILRLEPQQDTQYYAPTQLSLYGEDVRSITGNNVVLPETHLSITSYRETRDLSTVYSLSYEDVRKKRILFLSYNQSGEILDCFVNGESYYYVHGGYRVGSYHLQNPMYRDDGKQFKGKSSLGTLYQFQAVGNTLVIKILTEPLQIVTIPLKVTPSEWLNLLKGYTDPNLTANPLTKDTQLDSWMRLSFYQILEDAGVRWTSSN